MEVPDAVRKHRGALVAFLLRCYVEYWGLSAVTVMIGLLAEIPLFYIWIGVVVTFAMSMSALVRYTDWKIRTRVKYKVVFKKHRYGYTFDESGKPMSAHLGFELHNLADFPIDVEVAKLHTSLIDRHPPGKELENSRATIAPNGVVALDDHPIDLGELPDRIITVEGLIRASIRYGKAGGKLDEMLEIDIKLLIELEGSPKPLNVIRYDNAASIGASPHIRPWTGRPESGNVGIAS